MKNPPIIAKKAITVAITTVCIREECTFSAINFDPLRLGVISPVCKPVEILDPIEA